MTKSRIYRALGAALVAFCLVTGIGPGTLGAKTAQAAKFEVKNIDHMTLLQTILQGKGRVVLVNFFASWCSPCRQEMPHLKALRKTFSEDELLLVGVSVDNNRDEYEDFIRKVRLNYPVFLADDSVPPVFQVSSIPKTLIYGRDGALAVNHTGMAPGEALEKVVRDLLEKKDAK